MIERILGPVAALELVRLSRQRRFFVLRVAFIVALLVVLHFQMPTDAVSHAELANAANRVYRTTSAIALLSVIALTPAVVAPAIAGERAGDRLTFILVTPLFSPEIVLGKGVARALMIGQVLLGAVPVVALLQLVGGVSLLDLYLDTLIVGSMLAGLTALSLFMSVVCRTARMATIGVYGLVMVLAYLMMELDPFILVWSLLVQISWVSTLVFGGLACLLFRGMSRRYLGLSRRASALRGRSTRPVGEWVVWWWERAGAPQAGALAPWFAWAGPFLPMLVALSAAGYGLGEISTTFCVLLGTIALWRVAILAALSFADERNRHMLELLRTTSVGAGEVLLSKWFACIVTPWRGVAVLGVCSLCLPGLGVPLWQSGAVLALWLVYAFGVSALALLVSMLTQRPVNAMVITLSVLVFLSGGGAWLYGLRGPGAADPVRLTLWGAAPPLAFGWCATPPANLSGLGSYRALIDDAVAGGVVVWLTITGITIGWASIALGGQWEPARRQETRDNRV